MIEAESGTSVPHSTASRPPSAAVAIVQSIKTMQQQLVDVSLNGVLPAASDAAMARYRGAVEKLEASQKALTTVAMSLNTAQRHALEASDEVIEAAREAFGEDPKAPSDSASGSAQMNLCASLSQEKGSSSSSCSLRLARVEQQLALINVPSGSNAGTWPRVEACGGGAAVAFIYCSNSWLGALLSRKSRSSGVRIAFDLIVCGGQCGVRDTTQDGGGCGACNNSSLDWGWGLTKLQELSSGCLAGINRTT